MNDQIDDDGCQSHVLDPIVSCGVIQGDYFPWLRTEREPLCGYVEGREFDAKPSMRGTS